jgi:hypothetical protein
LPSLLPYLSFYHRQQSLEPDLFESFNFYLHNIPTIEACLRSDKFSTSLFTFIMKWTKRAPMTLLSGVINEMFSDDETKEKDDDYDIIMPDQSPSGVAFRAGENALPQAACEVSVHRTDRDSLIVKVVPPAEPGANETRAPIELVLLIDVSGSMGNLAPVPPSGEGGESEQKGFTVLDLTKHAAYTIVESLNEHDTLCIVTFSTECKVTDSFAL